MSFGRDTTVTEAIQDWSQALVVSETDLQSISCTVLFQLSAADSGRQAPRNGLP